MTIGPDLPGPSMLRGAGGPPKDVEPSELFTRLMQRRPSEVVPYPRDDDQGKPVGNVRIQVLRELDHGTARRKAFETLKAQWTDPQEWNSEAFKSHLGDETAKEVLAMALLEEKANHGEEEGNPYYKRIFPNAKYIAQLPPNEISALFNAYMVVQHKYGPWDHEARTKKELAAWIERLGEGAREFPLLSLSLPQLVELSSSLAAEVYIISAILSSQWENLPGSLKSHLETYSLVTYFAGKHAQSLKSGDSESFLEDSGSKLNEPISLEIAKEVAQRMRKDTAADDLFE